MGGMKAGSRHILMAAPNGRNGVASLSGGRDLDLSRSIDIYCERVGAAFWAEPINALTNLAFIAAAVFAWRRADTVGGGIDWTLRSLAVLAGLVGVGSFLFHTFAQAWSGVADVAAIWVFALAYTFISLHRFFGLGPFKVVLGLFVVVAAAYFGLLDMQAVWQGLGLPGHGGGARYLLAVIALAGLALALVLGGNRASYLVGLGAAVFAVSLTFRTIDSSVCIDFPLGTHFIWHLLNGTLFALLLAALPARGRALSAPLETPA